MRKVLPVDKSFIFALFERIPNTVCFCKLTSSYGAFENLAPLHCTIRLSLASCTYVVQPYIDFQFL